MDDVVKENPSYGPSAVRSELEKYFSEPHAEMSSSQLSEVTRRCLDVSAKRHQLPVKCSGLIDVNCQINDLNRYCLLNVISKKMMLANSIL